MESILTDYLGESGPFLATLALLVLVIGGILMGRLANEEERRASVSSGRSGLFRNPRSPDKIEAQRVA